jgi:hypothetical protein
MSALSRPDLLSLNSSTSVNTGMSGSEDDEWKGKGLGKGQGQGQGKDPKANEGDGRRGMTRSGTSESLRGVMDGIGKEMGGDGKEHGMTLGLGELDLPVCPQLPGCECCCRSPL